VFNGFFVNLHGFLLSIIYLRDYTIRVLARQGERIVIILTLT